MSMGEEFLLHGCYQIKKMQWHSIYTALKKTCDVILPKWFMSDDAVNYFNAQRSFCRE